MQKVSAFDIKTALAAYHRKDFFITECKNGSTYFPPAQGLLMFDGLAISKSWTNPCIRIYEIKVSRSDFLRDGKYHLYKQYCHEMYFACPKGLIKKEELPDEIGLLYYNPETKALRQVKKGLYRKIKIDADMLMYIIMNKLDSDRLPFFESNRQEYAKAYLENRAEKRNIGYMLGFKMAKDMAELYRIQEERDNQRAVEAMAEIKEIQKVLQKHGIYRWRTKGLAGEIDTALSENCPHEIKELKRHSDRIAEILAGMEGQSSG